jgi:hypothetical protein
MRVRGVRGEGQDSRRNGVMEWNSRSQKGFGSLEGRSHDWGPKKRMLGGTGISERAENVSNARKEATVEIKHAEESLEGNQIGRRREGEDRLDLGGQWEEARRCHAVS